MNDDIYEEMAKQFLGAKKPASTATPRKDALSQPELEDVLRQAGWDEQHIPRMSAIGMAESSLTPDGRAKVNSYNPGVGPGGKPTVEESIGNWQINMHPSLGRSYDRKKLANDPVYNAKAALDIFKQQGFKAWGAYTDGRYKKHYKAAAPQANPYDAMAKDWLSQPKADPYEAMASDYLTNKPPAQTPVPESPNTIAAQMQAAMNPAIKDRSAVLTTSQEQNAIFGNTPGFIAVPMENNQTLWVNEAKAKRLRLKTVQDIKQFVKKNPDGMTRLIGKVENVGNNTGGNQPVVATVAPDGTELSSSVVTNPDTAAKQAIADQASFPGAQTGITTTDEVARARQNVVPLDNQKQRTEVLAKALPGEQPTDTMLRMQREPVEREYADFLKQTGLPDDQAARDEFNLAQRVSVEGANAQNAIDNKAYNNEVNAYNASQPKRAAPIQPDNTPRVRVAKNITVNTADIPDQDADTFLSRKVGEQLATDAGVNFNLVDEFIKANGGTLLTGEPFSTEEVANAKKQRQTINIGVQPGMDDKFRRFVTDKQSAEKFAATEAETAQQMKDTALASAKGDGTLSLTDPNAWQLAFEKIIDDPFGQDATVTEADLKRVVDASVEESIKSAGSAIEAQRLREEGDKLSTLDKTNRFVGSIAKTILKAPASFAKTIAWAEDTIGYLRDKGIVPPTLTSSDILNAVDWVYSRSVGIPQTKAEAGKLPMLYANAVENLFKDDPVTAQLASTKFANAIGSAVPFLVGAALIGGGNVPVALMGIGMQVGESYDEAKRAGLSREKQLLTGALNIPIGASEVLGLKFGKLGALLEKKSGGVFAKSFLKWLTETGKEATEETLQEFLQSSTGDLVKTAMLKNGLDRKDVAKALGQAVSNAVTGGVVGALFGGGVPITASTAGALSAPNTKADTNALLKMETERVPTVAAEPVTEPVAEAEQAKTAKTEKAPVEKESPVQVDVKTPKVKVNEFKVEPFKGEVKAVKEDVVEQPDVEAPVVDEAPAKQPESVGADAKPKGTGLSNTQIEFSPEQAKPFNDFRKNYIKPTDVADKSVLPPYAKDGIFEIEPHVTVKYGLHTNKGDDVAPILKGEKPIKVRLGKTGVFVGSEKKIPGTDKPVPYDVVTVEVESEDLARLNKKLTDETENTTTFNDYKPHITLAYVKLGKGQKYANRTNFEGQEYTFDGVTFSPSDKSGKTVIPLASPSVKPQREAVTPKVSAHETASRLRKLGYTLPVQKTLSDGEKAEILAKSIKKADYVAEKADAVDAPSNRDADVRVAENNTSEQARKDGKLVRDGVEYVRQEPIKDAPTGKTGKIRFAEAEPDSTFKFRLIEADQLQSADLGGNTNYRHFLPEAQPKDRSTDASKLASDKIAQSPDLDQVSESPNAYAGAPIVNARGEVIQGNNRSEGLKKHYTRKGTSYKRDLATNAERFGFTPEQVKGMKSPVLVRELDVDDDSAIRLGQYTFSDLESGGKVRIDPVTTARRIPHADKGKMLKDVFQDADEDATLAQLIRANKSRITKHLDPYLTNTQKETMENSAKEFKPEAIKDIEGVLRHFLFDKGDTSLPDYYENLPFAAKQAITASLPKIFSVEQSKSIVPELQKAITAASRFQGSRSTDFETWAKQPDLMEGRPAPVDAFSDVELDLARRLVTAKTQKEIKDLFALYAKLANGDEATMFRPANEPLSKADALKEVLAGNDPLRMIGGEQNSLPLEYETVENKVTQSPELDGIIDSKGHVDYDRAKDVAGRIQRGSLEIRRLNPKAEQGRIAGGQRTLEASVLLGADDQHRQKASQGSGQSVESRSDTRERQEKLLENYAKREGIWYDWNKFFHNKHFTRGGEAFVYKQTENAVAKTIDYRHINGGLTPQQFIDDRIALFNYIFPETKYELMGFTRDANGKFRFLVKQPFIDAHGVSRAEVAAAMKVAGFESDGYETYKSSLYHVFDVHEKNAAKDAQGRVYVIDAVPKLADDAAYKAFEAVNPDNPLRSIFPNAHPDEIAAVEAAGVEVDREANFKRWFGDSKVVDENGKPLVVYHGTADDIESFKLGKTKRDDHGRQLEGIYFSQLPTTASAYARSAPNIKNREADIDGANVVPAFVSLQNPKEFGTWDYKEMHGTSRDELLRQGYDGVIRRNDDGEMVEVVAFRPEQIKSVNNNGNFDPNNDSILRSINASIESSASQEAINRSFSERGQGLKRVVVDTRSGNERPLIGVDAVDYNPRPYESVEFRGGGRNGEVISQGHSISPAYHTPLFKIRSAEDVDALYNVLPYIQNTGDLFEFADGGKVTNGELELSPYDAEVTRRLLAEVQKGQDVPASEGAVYNASTLRKMAKVAEAKSKEMAAMGYPASYTDNLDNLAKNLHTVAKNAAHGILYTFEESLPEERFHLEDLSAGRTSKEAIEQMKQSPLWDASEKFNRDYGKLSDRDKASEIVAKLATGQEKAYGWDKIDNFEKERAKLFDTWIEGVIAQNNITDIDAFNKEFTRLGAVYAEAKTNNNGTGEKTIDGAAGVQASSPESETETRREPEKGERVQSDAVQEEGGKERLTQKLTSREPGKSGLPFNEAEAKEATAQGKRVAAISRILGREYYYDPQTHEETEIRAEDLIGRKGVAQAIRDALSGKPSAEGMKVVYNEFARQNALYNHFKDSGNDAEAIATAMELADLANAITERQRATGQESEIAKTLDILSPDIALLMAQRRIIRSRGEGSKLTPEEVKTTTEIAKQLQDVEAKLEEARRKLRNSEAIRRRLESDKEPRKRPATSQEKLLKEYQAEKSDIIAKLEALFPGSPLFNGKEVVLRMTADAPLYSTDRPDLDPEQRELLTKWTTGQILEGLPYEPLINTLQQFGISEESAKEIQSDAVDVIKPAREPRTPDAKERTKIRNEHYRQAKAFDSGGKPKLSGIAQDAQEDPKYSDNEALIKVIDYLTNVNTAKEGRSLNQLINGIRADNPEMSIKDAEMLAGKAHQAVKDLRAKRKRVSDKAKGISEDTRTEINKLTVEKRVKSRRMADHLKQLDKGTEWAMHRFNNLMRGLFVNNHITQLFNAVQSTVVANPTQMALDGVTSMLKNALKIDIGESPDIDVKDMLLPGAYIFGNNKQVAEQALAHFPEEYFRIHAGILGDIEIDKVGQAQTAHWITKPLHGVFDLADTGLTKLSHFTGAKLQEMHFRNALIAARFDQLISHKSGRKETLESALKNGTFLQYVSEKDAARIADDALEVTFASEITDPVGKAMKKAYDQLDNFLPIFLNPVTYARFTYTTTKVMVLNPLTFGAWDIKSKYTGGRGYSTKSIAKGVLGWGGVMAAYALQAALGGDDDRWDTLYVNGKDNPPLSVKRFFPLSAYFYVAHLVRQAKDGGTPPTMEDMLEGLASLETGYYMYGPGMELGGAVKRAAWDGTGTKEQVGGASARMLGNFFGGMLSIFKPLKLAASVIDEDERALRDDSDNAKDKFIAEISRSLPLAIRLSDAPQKIDPVTDRPILQPWPLGRAVGLNMVHPSFLSNKDSEATQWADKLFSYKGGSGVMAAEERNAYFIRKRLKEAVRSGKIDLKTADEKARQYLAKVLSPQSMGRLQDELKLSELQSKIKYGFGMTDKKDIANLRTVWQKATASERDDIRAILRNKKNRTAEFNKEFGL